MKIAVITTTRADYGLLYWPLKKLEQDPYFDLKIIASGTHLSPHHGLTYHQIEEDGFQIDWKVEMLLSSDTAVGASKALALATIGFSECFDHLRPDLVLLLGDRYEMLAAAQSAMLANIPVAHIAGGDVTEGAFDESIRHSITKMAHIHFPTNNLAGERIKQMGENPDNIHVVGSPGLDYIAEATLMRRAELEKSLGIKFGDTNLLVTYHPETLEKDTKDHFAELVKALGRLDKSIGIIFTRPNSDPGAGEMNRQIDDFRQKREGMSVFASLGSTRYLSVVSIVDAVVGNSSSGLYEAPSLQTPTVNIGDRQKGRIQAASVINSRPEAEQILKSIEEALALNCSDVVNPYGDGNASERIVDALKRLRDPQQLIRKQFFKLGSESS